MSEQAPVHGAPSAADPAMQTARLVALEERFAAHNYHPLDVVIARGEGPYVWDVAGRRYLDCLSAYSALNQGHCHPRIVEAATEQLQRLTLTSRAFRNDRFGPLCAKLSKLTGYERVLLMNTGAEAVETAIKAVRRHAYEKRGVAEGKAEIVVFDDNFHGRTTTIVGFSSEESSRKGYGPFAPGFVRVPFGDLAAVGRSLSAATAAVLVEPVQGEAGVILPPPGFLQGLRELCDRHGALLVCDEIQSGLGRAGALLAHREFGVRADAVTIGKALGGGLYPVSAFLADKDVMDVFTPGSHGSTFGGNPLACAIADAALDVIVDEDLCARSKQQGAWFLERLRAIRSRRIKAVRGMGLWLAIELHPEAGGARAACEALLREGILCKDTHGHTIRLAPALAVARADLEATAAAIARVLADGT